MLAIRCASKDMGDEFVTYIKHLYPLVNLFMYSLMLQSDPGRLGSPQKMKKITIPRGNESPLQGISSNVLRFTVYLVRTE